MGTRIAVTTAGLGLAAALVPLGSPAHAAECVGAQGVPPTFVCVVRRDLVVIDSSDDPLVSTPTICVVLVCAPEDAISTEPNIDGDEIAVLYHGGKCYYAGTGPEIVADATSTSPPACP